MVSCSRFARAGASGRFISDLEFRIVTLCLRDEGELRRRLSDRAAGYRDADSAIDWNRRVRERALLPNEERIEVDGLSVDDFLGVAFGASG